MGRESIQQAPETLRAQLEAPENLLHLDSMVSGFNSLQKSASDKSNETYRPSKT